jgi:hypothetical protein
MKKNTSWSGNRREFLSTAAQAIVPFLLLSSCGGGQGTFDPFRVKQFGCTKLRAENGEGLTLTWDYGNPGLLKMQKLRFLRLHLSGFAQEMVDLDLSTRSFTFAFNGPITVEIQATTETVTDTLPFKPRFSAALTVSKLQDLFFRGVFASASNTPTYPYLGYSQNNNAEFINGVAVEFTQFAGFFDANNNGRVDPLIQFLPNAEAFRALSIGGNEVQSFGFREGPNFPFRLFSTPGLGRVNGLILICA